MRLAMFAAAMLLASRASADPQATCDRLEAEAQSQADVLVSPSIDVQGAHIPVVDVNSLAVTASGSWQGRVSFGWSPSDLWRGLQLERIADVDCKRTRVADKIDRVLAVGDRYGEVAAARAELQYLADHMKDVDALVDDAQTRFEHQRATAVELDELRERRTSLALQIAERKETLATLEQLNGPEESVSDLSALLPAYRDSAVELEREQGKLREVAPWNVKLSGGVAESDQFDWFAVVDVSYSVGGLWQHSAEERAAEARRREVAHDVHDTSVRVDMLRRAMHASQLALTEELGAVDQMLEKLHQDLARIGSLDDANDASHQLRARYTIQAIQLEARRAAITALVAARRALAGDPP